MSKCFISGMKDTGWCPFNDKDATAWRIVIGEEFNKVYDSAQDMLLDMDKILITAFEEGKAEERKRILDKFFDEHP